MSDSKDLYIDFGSRTITLPDHPVPVGYTIVIEANHCPVTIQQPAQTFIPIPPETE